MVDRTLGALLTVLATLLAGCAGGAGDAAAAPPPTTAPAPTATETDGSVTGVVSDDEARPIVGATVALLELASETQSDTAGTYTLNDVPPGQYSLAVEKLGYEAKAVLVDVVAGEVTMADLTLLAIEIREEPIAITVPHEGFIACSWNPYFGLNVCGGLGGEDTSRFPFEIDGTLEWKELVAELTWQPTTAVTAQQLEIDICDLQTGAEQQAICAGAQSYWDFQHGPSPVVMRRDDLPVDETLSYEVDVTAPWVGDDPTSFVFQQSFTLYLTLCYIEECADEFTALPPG